MSGPVRSPRSSPAVESRKVPRPVNCWFIFRAEMAEKMKLDPELRQLSQIDISKIAGKMWREMTDEERAVYQDRASLVREQHRRDHPDLQYRNWTREEKQKEREEKQKERAEKQKERAEKQKERAEKQKERAEKKRLEKELEQLAKRQRQEAAQREAMQRMMAMRPIYELTAEELANFSPPVSEAPSPFGSPMLPPQILGWEHQ